MPLEVNHVYCIVRMRMRSSGDLGGHERRCLACRDAFMDDVGSTIEEIVVGTGACGELRYPSYVEANGWRFPGVRAF
jgi:hypothetical protein